MCTCLYLFIYFLLSWQLAVMLPFFFFFFLFFFFFRATLPLLFFIFLFSRPGSGRSFFFLFFSFDFLGLVVGFFFFFKDLIFIFLVNLGDCSFFFCGYLSLFCFNWASFFNNGILVNLFKLIFFHPSTFSLPTKQK